MNQSDDFFQWTMRSLYYDQTRCDESAIDLLWNNADPTIKQEIYQLSVSWTEELAQTSAKTHEWIINHVPKFENSQ